MALPQFIKPYPDGYENGEIGNTPVTAEILNTNYDGFLLNLNDWISGVDGDISELETAIGTIPSDLDDLSDIVITSPSDGQVLKYDNATGKWINGSGGSGGASSLNDLNDVTISNPSNGQIVEYNSSTSKWENKNAPSIPDDLNDLTDVNISSPSDGQFLKYDNTSGKWKNASGGSGGADDLSDLGDVTISTPTDGQVLTYDDNSNKWINSDPTGGSGGHTIVNDSGTSLSQEDNLQFSGVYAYDDSTNDQTVVAVSRQMTRSQFNLLSAAEKKGLIQITDEVEPDDSMFYPEIYSLTEHEVGVWTDGKPLYVKTFEFDINDLQSETYGKYIEFSIDDIDKICLYTTDLEDGIILLPYYLSYSNFITTFPMLSTDKCTFHFRYGSEIESQLSAYFVDCKAILYYTKTTDTAGSGQWTPQGVPAVHYSTDEQVIGTWLGETLYQKTIVNTNALSGTSTTIDVSALNVGSHIEVIGAYFITDGSYYEITPLPFTNGSYYACVNEIIDGSITLVHNADLVVNRARDGYVITIRYTKQSS